MSKRIAVIADHTMDFGRDISRAIIDYRFKGASDEWEVVLFSDLGDFASKGVNSSGYDGIIAPIYRFTDFFVDLNVPVISITEPAEDCPFPSVTFDNDAIGRMAAQHLAELGIGHAVCVELKAMVHKARNNGFQRELERFGIPWEQVSTQGSPAEFVAFGRFIPELGHLKFPNDGFPVGMFCGDDAYGVWGMRSIQRMGYRVPDEVAIISVNNDSFICRSATPELSSIDTDPQQVGHRAAEQLNRLLCGLPATDKIVRIPPKRVVVRHSTDRLDIEDPNVANAMRYVRAHIGEFFDVSDVVHSVGIPRRTLEKRFHDELDQSIYQAIVAERLDRAEELLVETTMINQAIAARTGFPNESSFYMAFQRRHGLTPSQFRNGNRQND